MRITKYGLALVCIALSGALSGSALGLKHDALPLATTPPTGQWFDYVLNIMLENHSINFTYYNGGSVNSCIGNCTYFTSLANANGLAMGLTNGNVNASTASYIAMTSGYGNAAQLCNSGPNAAGCPYLQILNIVDRLESAGLTWKAYMEGYPQPPSGCFTNYNSAAPFYYTPNHNPFLYYADIVNSTARCARIVNANSQPVIQNSTGCWPSALQNDDVLIKDLNSVTNASNYMWLTPNTLDQTHDCNDVSLGNAWLNEMVPQILGSTLFKTKRAALFITFDEPGCSNPAGQPPCPTLPSPAFYSVWASNPSDPTTRSSFKSTQSYMLYSPLKAVEVNWGLPSLTTKDANANSMSEFFALLSASFSYSPSSIQPGQQVTFTASATGGASPYTYNWGFGDGATATGGTVTHAYNTAGIYNAQLAVTDKQGAIKNVTQSITVGPNFSISSSPSSLTLHTGSSNTSRVILSSVNGFSGSVSLATSVSSSGLNASLNIASVNLPSGGNASSTLTVSSTNPATYAINATGTSGANVHTTTIAVRVTTADFSISATPTSLTIQPSTTGTSVIQLTSLNQFSGAISLSASVSQPGLVSSLGPPTLSLFSGGSATSTLTFSSLNYGNYTLTVTGTSGSLSHSAAVAVRVFPSSVALASDSRSGATSLYTTGGQKLIQDSAGKMIAVYVDSSGRISLSYDNTDPSKGGWSTPMKSPTPTFAYSWPAAVLVSLNSLRIIAVGGSVSGAIVDIPITISRGSGNNVTGFSFGTPTPLDSSGLGKYTAAILLHNNDILAAWGWENTTTSIVKSLRWDQTTGWTSLTGSSTIPDTVFVDNSLIQYFVPNMIERPDNHIINLFALRFVSSGLIAFDKASWNGSAWSWGSQNLTYETNASDADDDAIGLSWDPGRSLVVAEYGISGTHTYGVFTLTSTDVKTHIDTPTLAVTGDRGWGAIGVQTNTGDYYLFLISVGSDAGSGTLGYVRMSSGGSWNATITWLNTATDNQVTSLRTTGPNPSLDLLYVEGTTAPANVKFVRLGAPSFTITPNPAGLSIQEGAIGTSTIALSSLFNFAGTINLSTTVSPPGTTATLTPATVMLTSGIIASSMLSFNPTTTGVYTITIQSTNGLLSQTATITVTVTDFNIALSPSGITVSAGASGTSTVTVTSLNGLTGTVTLSVSASTPVGLTCTLPASVSFGISPQTATLRCSAAAAGNYTVTVTGTSGTLTHTTPTVLFHAVDFSISAGIVSPTQILAGGSGTSTITVAALNGLIGTVNLAVSTSTPAGLACTLPASVTFGTSPQTAILSCSAATAADYAVTVTGTDGALTHTTAGILFHVVDFTIAAGAVSPAQILAGASGTSTITMTALNGLTGTVDLTVSALPAGLTCILPASVTFGSSSQIAMLSCSSSIANTYNVIVTGTNGTLSHTTPAMIFVVVDFSIATSAVSPPQLLAGSSGNSTVTLTSLNGFTGIVNLTTNSTSCTLSSTVLTSPGNLTLSCSFASAGTVFVTVTGTSGSLSHQAGVSFSVQDFAITSSVSTVTILAGSTGTSTIILSSLNGFSIPVNLATNSTSCAMSPSSLTSLGNSTVSCAFTNAGTIDLVVTGASGPRSHTTMVTFVVQDYGVNANPTSVVLNVGAASTSIITIGGLNGFSGIVSLTTNSTDCTVSLATVTSSGSANLSCSFTSVLTKQVTVTGQSASLSHSTVVTFVVQDFTITAGSPGASNVNSGSNSTITAGALNQFSGTISLGETIPPEMSCGPVTPATLTASGTASVSCSAVSPGNYTLTVTATSTNLVHTITLTFSFQDYAIVASSPASSIVSSSAVSTITVRSQNGFSGLVSLSDALPSGLDCDPITPTGINGAGAAVLSCNSAVAGNYTLTITTSSTTLTHSATITLIFGDFSLTASVPPASRVGLTASSTISVNSMNHYSGTVVLSDTIPAGLSCLPLSPMSLTGSGTSVVSCSGISAGNYTLQILGTAGPLTRSSSVIVQISDYNLAAGPTSVTSYVGGNATFTINVTSLDGYSGTVNAISQSQNATSTMGPNGAGGGHVRFLASLPPALNFAVKPDSEFIASGGTGLYTLTVGIPLGMPVGNYAIIITASDGQLSHTTQVTLVVTDFNFTSPTNVMSISPGNNATVTLSLQSLNGFQGNLILFSNINPAGPVATLSPSSLFLITESNFLLVINVQSNVQPGHYNLTIMAMIGTLSHQVYITIQVPSEIRGLLASFGPNGATYTGLAELLTLIVILPPSMRDRDNKVRRRKRHQAAPTAFRRRSELPVSRSRVVVTNSLLPFPVNS